MGERPSLIGGSLAVDASIVLVVWLDGEEVAPMFGLGVWPVGEGELGGVYDS